MKQSCHVGRVGGIFIILASAAGLGSAQADNAAPALHSRPQFQPQGSARLDQAGTPLSKAAVTGRPDAFPVMASGSRFAFGPGGFGPVGFEIVEGYLSGPLSGQNGWTSFLTSGFPDDEGHIDTVHPAGGVQHGRISDDPGADNNIGSFSPNIVPVPAPGVVTLTVDLSIPDNTTKFWRIQPQSPSQGQLTAGMQFNPDGSIFVFDDNGDCTDAFVGFVDTGFTWTPDVYVTARIVVDVPNERVRYFYGADLVHSTGAGEGGIGGPLGCGIFAGSIIEHTLIFAPEPLPGGGPILDGTSLDFDNLSILAGAGAEPTGACCAVEGDCSRVPADDCAAAGGIYAGNNVDCAQITCDLVEICETATGSCFDGNGTPGCELASCCLGICQSDPFCCIAEWDEGCAALASSPENAEICPPPSICPACPDGCTGTPNCQPIDPSNAAASTGEFSVADNFTPLADGNIEGLCWSGAYLPEDLPGADDDDFHVRYYACEEGVPGAVLAEFSQSGGTLTLNDKQITGQLVAGAANIFEYSASHAAVAVAAGTSYFVEIVNTVTGDWYWEWGTQGDDFGYQRVGDLPWARHFQTARDSAFCLELGLGAPGGLCELPPHQPCLLGDLTADFEENEPCGQVPDVNSGCSDNSGNFSPILALSPDGAVPTVVHGKSWASAGERDLDWFTAPIDSACDQNDDGACTLCLSIASELPLGAVPVLEDTADGECNDTRIFALDANGFECTETLAVAYAVVLAEDLNAAGEIYLLVRPDDGIDVFDGAPCGGNGSTTKGNDYLLKVALVDTTAQCFPCLSDADCAQGQTCVDGVCTQLCADPSCVTDLNSSGQTDPADLAQLLGAWGAPGCGGAEPCCSDLNNDGIVNAVDLAQLLGAWGPCP